jgi:ferric-dicitrate binding protein FerR (iron transport regulator)
LSAEHGEAVKRAELAEAHAAALAEEVERIRKWREDAPALVQAIDPASELAALLRRAELAEARCSDLTEEVARLREWRRSSVSSVIIVALLAILMLGIVAFNAVDSLGK